MFHTDDVKTRLLIIKYLSSRDTVHFCLFFVQENVNLNHLVICFLPWNVPDVHRHDELERHDFYWNYRIIFILPILLTHSTGLFAMHRRHK